MKTTIEIKSIKGEILYSYTCENNSIKLTVETAVKNKISLCGADLSYANLEYADLMCADLYNAILTDVKKLNAPLICPKDGSFVAYKKVCYNLTPYIITLEIPVDAKRSSATSDKCRCDKAKVLSIIDIDTNENVDSVINNNYVTCKYKVNETVYPDSFDKNRFNECSHGIHFFMNKECALDY
jgi:hypothetical protein